jgi:hypothetical protein
MVACACPAKVQSVNRRIVVKADLQEARPYLKINLSIKG